MTIINNGLNTVIAGWKHKPLQNISIKIYLQKEYRVYTPSLTAEVAELVDALASGASGLLVVGVQVPLSAPFFLLC